MSKDDSSALRETTETLHRLVALWPRLTLAASRASIDSFREISGQDYSLIDYPGVWSSAAQLAAWSWLNPFLIWRRQAELLQALNGGTASSFEIADNGPTGRTGDKRFADKAWDEDPTLRMARDVYLAVSASMLEYIQQCDALSDHDKHKLTFYTRQMLSAMSPSNNPWLNPKVRARTRETQGASLVRGLENLVADLETGRGMVPISQNDPNAFQVGKSLAITPGKVVYRNELMELIQYEPATDTVYERPLVVVPPWINKYYVLDLQPENSFLRWVIAQGHTVFVVSWVNPTSDHAKTSFDDYMEAGPLRAIDIAREITGQADVNVLGFCIGGILTLCTLAHLGSRRDRAVRSATFLATMIDMSDVGDTAAFVDEAQFSNIEKHTGRVGFLDGHHMKDMFSLLRENDLVWNYVISNYLMGREPPAFDILHWNGDSTRLPAKMITQFLREHYMNNGLMKPGKVQLNGHPVDVRSIKAPSYFISTIDDHIAPWRASYPATQLLSDVTFVLGGSGHIAGIVNPPARRKYGYWTGAQHPSAADDWLAKAQQNEGSWWPHWSAWLAPHGGQRVRARDPGSNAFPPLVDAPGQYVVAP